jgi:hypothetical protein
MHQFPTIAKALAGAALSTALALIAYAALSRAGLGAEVRLIAGLVVAGLANIHGLASLNGDLLLPTSRTAVGELSK